MRMAFKPAFLLTLAASALAIPAALSAMPPASQWEIGPVIKGRSFSIGMPTQPDAAPNGAVSFRFPGRGGEVDALTTRIAPLDGARRVTMRYRIDAARGTAFVPAETPGETATVSLYFQQRGDNWSARGRYGSYRWYVPARAVVPLVSGERTISIRLDDIWTNVNGQPNTADRRGFANALANTDRLGIAFGTSSRRGHGVYATGPARFTLLDLEIE